MSETSNFFESLYLKEGSLPSGMKAPYLNSPYYLINGEMLEWKDATSPVHSPIYFQGKKNPIEIGRIPMLTKKEALEALDAAVKAYDNGRGEWPLSSAKTRIYYMIKYLNSLKANKDKIIELLMWEICKTLPDAQKEVDRTINYINDTINALKDLENKESTFTEDSGVIAQIRRAPYGVVVCLGPFNNPFNETYTTLIPALIMGNTVVMKLPKFGALCHMPTLSMFKEIFPPGVINIISGSGHEILPPIMASGKIDVFAFIGTSKAADDLQKAHPKPHRLRVCLGLEAKNPAIILPDADLNIAITECITGTLSYNGQRCTALKIIFVHKDITDSFLPKFVSAVDDLKMGLPWEVNTKITPLPEEGKPSYLNELVHDALTKGGKIINPRGGKIDRSFVAPTIIYPVLPSMRLYHEEQFGPVIPVRSFESLDEIYEYISSSPYGQQASIFSRNPDTIAPLIDVLANEVSRININTQCQRGPDNFPFTARKDSAYGTLSVFDALRVFSLRALVATKEESVNEEILNQIVTQKKSKFLRTDYIF